MSKVIDMIMDGLKLGVQIIHLDREHAEALVDEMHDARDLIRRLDDYLTDVYNRVEHQLPYRLDHAIRLAQIEVEDMNIPPTIAETVTSAAVTIGECQAEWMADPD